MPHHTLVLLITNLVALVFYASGAIAYAMASAGHGSEES